jgi:trans-2,3-dihydro-3-hydroxyanthranilate isomerase
VTRYEYRTVDVFTDKPFGGNPLAVFREPGKLDAATMQAIAKELHLSETTFVLPPSSSTAADHRVRIFTPDAELPFAGHPTIGTAFVLADGKDGTTRLEEGVGVIRVTLREGFVQMDQPLPTFTGTTITRKAAAEALGLAVEEVRSDVPIQTGSSGVPFLFVPLANLKAVRRARRPAGLDASVYVFAMSGERSGSQVLAACSIKEWASAKTPQPALPKVRWVPTSWRTSWCRQRRPRASAASRASRSDGPASSTSRSIAPVPRSKRSVSAAAVWR